MTGTGGGTAGGPDGGTSRVVDQRGLYYEELEQGVLYRHSPGRTVGEADNTLFSTLTMNPQALHLDAAYSATQEFGERLVNSLMTMSIVVGLSVGHLTQSTIVANLGFESVAFPHPVLAGDTIRAESTVEAKRLSRSRPGQGIVTFRHVGRNQHGVVVATLLRTVLMLCRPEPATSGEPA
ncbi:MaoC family dehydratase [Nakamurella endophytica]|uniref:MaoC family dehydratase n=1 Tax=Nakamurella endophytica TaxID=1748367 RepID=A0A917SUX3_9ACTN|nr:MaoC family dehydratase [Nakamurella endophytica]GGM00089.1 MaoC family dehydratase [Nakamurella endophytica]